MEDAVRNAPLFLALDDEASVALKASIVEMVSPVNELFFQKEILEFAFM
jgi:hypothetical protein